MDVEEVSYPPVFLLITTFSTHISSQFSFIHSLSLFPSMPSPHPSYLPSPIATGYEPDNSELNPYLKLFLMLFGLGAWATLPSVIGGYIGNPFTGKVFNYLMPDDSLFIRQTNRTNYPVGVCQCDITQSLTLPAT